MLDFVQFVRGIQDRLDEQAQHCKAQDKAPKQVKKKEGRGFHRSLG